ncbi:LOW QUALITY PROTEIN: tuberin [Nilaparvata lugens]|uniref:LOW QUALITY PROTEIN: tuberin n=1 Tax=Nilaparvata lugens TaxID=108931 RepID=UPI00193E3FED|nr:LOW QUALITY PROTEIN: tuberin [Nilaparvata lugens]
MGTKEPKDSKTMDKLKQFFRLNKGGANYKYREDFILTPELIKDLSPESSMNHRMKALKELMDNVVLYRLEDHAAEKLWTILSDLLQDNVALEHRHTAFAFFRCLVNGQYERLGMLRVHFFNLIKHENSEDIEPRLDLLISLTENGKDILHFEEEIGPFLLEWTAPVVELGRAPDLLELFNNVLKYNAAYIDGEVVDTLMANTCFLCCHSPSDTVIQSCLHILDTIVCYSNIPRPSFPSFIATLCRTVNVEAYALTSWKIMRNVMGTYMGHSSIGMLCSILKDDESLLDPGLMRGAVFYLMMGLWSQKKVTSLKISFTAILTPYIKAFESKHPVVIFEVISSVHCLVKRHGQELEAPCWRLVLEICQLTASFIETLTIKVPCAQISSYLHDTLNLIEHLIDVGHFRGSLPNYYSVIEKCYKTRPEVSVLRLINFLAMNIAPSQLNWMEELNSLVERFYKNETRPNIRIKTVDVLLNIYQISCGIYGKEIVQDIVLVHLVDVHLDEDQAVRTAVAQVIMEICSQYLDDPSQFFRLMEIVEKILVNPFKTYDASKPSLMETDCKDVETVVEGLIKNFSKLFCRSPAKHAVHTYQVLVGHLDMHNNRPTVFDYVPSIRCKIIDWLIKLRADSDYKLGCPVGNEVQFSAFIRVNHRQLPPPSPSPCPSPSPIPPRLLITYYYLSLANALKAIVICMRHELDWQVMSMILQETHQIIKNRALVLSRLHGEVDRLAGTLCAMFLGLASRSARQCVTALTVCTLELRDAMVKLLPEVLLNLSKITATVHIAIPMLEFLSTLTRIPKVFYSFVGDQYMSVFAISLPYTNPFKYNHYTVSLAHHVIAVWFLKCRLPFRRDFVKFIIKGLRANVLAPFEEEDRRQKADFINEDSSNRKRSSSLTEQGSRTRARQLAGARLENARPPVDLKPQLDESLMTFHRELTETCIDLMVRYTHFTSAGIPKRLSTADFLLNGGQSVTWIIGHKLITVTTSGCCQKALKHGLCDRCAQFCRINKDNPLSPTSETAGDQDKKAQTGMKHTSLSRSSSNDIPQMPLASNSSTAASSPNEEMKRGIESLTLESDPNRVDQIIFSMDRREPQICACWCQGWAEIHVKRPTGDMSWIMRLQNHKLTAQTDVAFADVATLLFPTLSKKSGQDADLNIDFDEEDIASFPSLVELRQTSDPVSIPGSPIRRSPSRHSSRDSVETMGDEDDDLDDGRSGRSRNPVRRSNSSPEMSASWKNPFLSGAGLSAALSDEERLPGRADSMADKKKTAFSKDLRVNCEAIPEEIGGLGTTPPSVSQGSMASHQPAPTTVPQPISQPAETKQPAAEKPPVQPSEQQPKKGFEASTTTSVPATTMELKRPDKVALAALKISDRPVDGGQASTTTHKPGLPALNPTPAHLTSKPPLSPPPSQLSPRLQPKHIKDQDLSRPDPSSLAPLAFRRDRGYTISVMSPVRKPRSDWDPTAKVRLPPSAQRPKEQPRSGVSPCFVFLQLYHNAFFGHSFDRPICLPSTNSVQRAVKNLDWINPYEIHKIGVVYVGPGQANNETEILGNKFGSCRYSAFLQNLGTCIKLSDTSDHVFLGGLDKTGEDGIFSYIWEDDVMQVIFHIATLMPNNEDVDPHFTNKKKHIGNDFVTIVYNESGEDYNIKTLKAQFSYASVVVRPLEHDCNEVLVKARDDLVEHIGHTEPKIVSDKNVALLARQLALHANLASMISQSLSNNRNDPYASNWLERLRQIKRIKTRAMQELSAQGASSGGLGPNADRINAANMRQQVEDFTEYT